LATRSVGRSRISGIEGCGGWKFGGVSGNGFASSYAGVEVELQPNVETWRFGDDGVGLQLAEEFRSVYSAEEDATPKS
jgi:hypothetical protein